MMEEKGIGGKRRRKEEHDENTNLAGQGSSEQVHSDSILPDSSGQLVSSSNE